MKLFSLLQSLNEKEKNKFHDFVNTKLFNQRKDVIDLLDLMLTQQEARPNPESTWKKINPNKKFSSPNWHLLSSRLFKLLEDFLAVNQFQKEESAKASFLSKAYRSLGRHRFLEKAIDQHKKILSKPNFKDIRHLQDLHNIEQEQYDYITSVNRKEPSNLQAVSDSMDHFFMAAKLRQACHALSRSIIRQEEYQINFIKEIIRLIQANPTYLGVPSIAIYYNCYRLINEEENEPYFKELRKSIGQFHTLFPADEMRDIYTIAINYSIRKLNTGAEHYIREAFELYQLSLNQGFLIENAVMQDSTYSNLVSLACKLKYFDWAIKFVHEQKQYLKKSSQFSLFHYSLGKIYYEQGQLSESLKELVVIEAKAPFIFLGARVLQLKIYYELGEFDPLESLLESLRVYLHRSKNLAYRKAHYSTIISFTKQLLQLPKMTKSEKEALKAKILATEVLGEKQWLLKAIQQSS